MALNSELVNFADPADTYVSLDADMTQIAPSAYDTVKNYEWNIPAFAAKEHPTIAAVVDNASKKIDVKPLLLYEVGVSEIRWKNIFANRSIVLGSKEVDTASQSLKQI